MRKCPISLHNTLAPQQQREFDVQFTDTAITEKNWPCCNKATASPGRPTVIRDRTGRSCLPIDVGFAPKATEALLAAK
jgi:hypothetical protein